jgi:mannose-1-phosphate guanylyltransferase
MEKKERVTITLPMGLLKQVDDSVDGKEIRNRSHAIEQLVYKALSFSEVKTAVILAGGKGTRLRPFTEDTPKPMLMINGKPIVEHTVKWLRDNGFEKIVFAVGYRKEKVEDYFGNGKDFGVSIVYSEEDESNPMGTAGALLNAREHMDSIFLVINGDILSNFNLRAMVEFHQEHSGILTVALKSMRDPSKYGVADLDGQKIVNFVEKPPREEAPTNLVNAGIYVANSDIFNYIEVPSWMEFDVIPKLVDEGKVYGYPFSGPWIDIEVKESLEKAKEIW